MYPEHRYSIQIHPRRSKNRKSGYWAYLWEWNGCRWAHKGLEKRGPHTICEVIRVVWGSRGWLSKNSMRFLFIADLSEFWELWYLIFDDFDGLVYFFPLRILLLLWGSCAPRCRLEGLGVGLSRATLLGAHSGEFFLASYSSYQYTSFLFADHMPIFVIYDNRVREVGWNWMSPRESS